VSKEEDVFIYIGCRWRVNVDDSEGRQIVMKLGTIQKCYCVLDRG